MLVNIYKSHHRQSLVVAERFQAEDQIMNGEEDQILHKFRFVLVLQAS